jgi:hypothetical protein
MVWLVVLATLGVIAVNFGVRRTMESALGEGASWEMATRRAASNLEQIAGQVRSWLPVSIIVLAALVAPESRRNGTTQFALSCGVRRQMVAAAQFLALATVVVVVVAVVHIGFAVAGLPAGAMSTVDIAMSWAGLMFPMLGLALSVFAFSLTATALETYLVFLGLPFLLRTVPSLVGGVPKSLPRLLARMMDNVGLLFPEPEELIPWPHLRYGTSDVPPAPAWEWPLAHLCVVLTFWFVLALWRYQRHDFGSRTAVK